MSKMSDKISKVLLTYVNLFLDPLIFGIRYAITLITIEVYNRTVYDMSRVVDSFNGVFVVCKQTGKNTVVAISSCKS